MKTTLTTLFLAIAFNCYTQDISTVDRLLDSVDVYNSKTINYAYDALDLAKTLEYDKGIAKAYHKIGYIFSEDGNYPKAFENYLYALEVKKLLGDNEGHAHVLLNCAHVFNKINSPAQVIKYSNEVLSLTGNHQFQIEANTNIARSLSHQGNEFESIKYWRKTIELCKTTDINMAEAYNMIGNSHLRLKEYDSALHYFNLLEKHAEGKDKNLSLLYLNRGVTYHLLGDCKGARENYLKALGVNHKDDIGKIYLNLAELEYQCKNFAQADKYLAEAKTHTHEQAHLARTLTAMAKFEEANQVKDNIIKLSEVDLEIKHRSKYKVEGIENQIAHKREMLAIKEKFQAERENKFYLMIISVLVVVIGTYLAYKYFRKAKKKEEVLEDVDKILDSISSYGRR